MQGPKASGGESLWSKRSKELLKQLTGSYAFCASAFCLASAPGSFLRAPIGVFLGSAIVSLIALWIGSRAGVLYGDTPDWAWVPAMLLIDVAHVYATGFRVYLDADEFKRRPLLYPLVP